MTITITEQEYLDQFITTDPGAARWRIFLRHQDEFAVDGKLTVWVSRYIGGPFFEGAYVAPELARKSRVPVRVGHYAEGALNGIITYRIAIWEECELDEKASLYPVNK